MCAPPVITNLISIFDDYKLVELNIFNLLYYIGIMASITSIYNCTVINLIVKMYKYRRFEFQNHFKRMLLIYFATIASQIFIILCSAMALYYEMCENGSFLHSRDFPDHHPFYNEDDPVGICASVIPIVKELNESYGTFSWIYIVTDITMLIPVLTFICLDKPHDCFACLGKDPDRNYSIF